MMMMHPSEYKQIKIVSVQASSCKKKTMFSNFPIQCADILLPVYNLRYIEHVCIKFYYIYTQQTVLIIIIIIFYI